MDRLTRYRIELLIFTWLLLCYVYVPPRWADWNQNSRIDLALAMVDQGTLSIDSYYQNTGDYAIFNGHHYSDKAPGSALLAAPVYAAIRPILRSAVFERQIARLAQHDAFGATLRAGGSGLLSDKIYFAIVLYVVTFVVVSIPSALLGVLIYRFLANFDVRPGWRAAVALLYGLATNAFPYAGSFFSHQIVAFLLFGAFYLAFAIGQRRIGPRATLLVGFMLGYAAISEYPTVLIGAAVFVYMLIVLRERRWWVGVVLGGLPPALALMAYDWAIFGNILPIGYEHSALYSDIHGQGFISLVGPNLPALWGISFGVMRGLFFVAPILLLAAPGFLVWWRWKSYRREWLVCAWSVASFFVFNGSSIMWQGGFAIGPRYLLPMVPFMAVGLGAFVVRFGRRGWGRALIMVLGAWSFVVVWAQTLGGQSFPDWTPNPLFDYSIPRLVAGDIARNLGMVFNLRGWASLIPLVLAMLALIVTLVWQIHVAATMWSADRASALRGLGNEAASS